MDHDVVVIGSINADLVLEVARHPHPGETVLGTRASVLPGGKGANQAVAAARLGARVAMVGAVGTDAYAQVALSSLIGAGADLAHVTRTAGATGLAVVTVGGDGENSIVVVPGANEAVTTEAVDRATDLLRTSAVCVLQAEIPVPTVVHAARAAHEAGCRVVLNVAPACALPPEVLRLADPLVVNEHEAAIVLGDDAGEPARPPADLLERLVALGMPSVVLTLGAAGLIAADRGARVALPARAVTVRDTTGAGDAFVGALAAGLADGRRVGEAAVTATRVAASSVQRLGAQASYPWKDDPLP